MLFGSNRPVMSDPELGYINWTWGMKNRAHGGSKRRGVHREKSTGDFIWTKATRKHLSKKAKDHEVIMESPEILQGHSAYGNQVMGYRLETNRKFGGVDTMEEGDLGYRRQATKGPKPEEYCSRSRQTPRQVTTNGWEREHYGITDLR